MMMGTAGVNVPLEGDIGIFWGGGAVKDIEYITITSTGNSAEFGDAIEITGWCDACGSSTRSIAATNSAIEYNLISTTSNSTNFGELTIDRSTRLGGCSNSTRGLFAGQGGTSTNSVDYITISSIGNASDFGDLVNNFRDAGAVSSTTRAIFAVTRGDATRTDYINYFTISSIGNATDFGDLNIVRLETSGCSNNTIGLFCGYEGSGQADKIVIASTGNATDFGNATVAVEMRNGTGNTTRGVFAGGITSNTNVMDYFTYSSAGNANDFGDLSSARGGVGATSNCHGGL